MIRPRCSKARSRWRAGAALSTPRWTAAGGSCCLIGTSTSTQGTLAKLGVFGEDIGGPALAASGGLISCEHVGGGGQLNFAADRTASIAFDGQRTRSTARAQGAIFIPGTCIDHTDFARTVRGEGSALVRSTGQKVGWTNIANLGPVTQTSVASDDAPTSSPSGFAFTCDGTSLTVTRIYGL